MMKRTRALQRTALRLVVAAAMIAAALPAAAQTITVGLQAAPTQARPGGRVGYSASVFNDGTSAKDITLSFGFDPNLSLAAAHLDGLGTCLMCQQDSDCPLGGTCLAGNLCSFPPLGPCAGAVPGSGGTQWTVNDLNPGVSVRINLEMIVNGATPVTDPEALQPRLISSATAAELLPGGGTGPSTVIQQSTMVFADGHGAPFIVNLGATPMEVTPGGELSYRATVINQGATARDIPVSVAFDPNFVFSAFDSDSPVCILPLPGCVVQTSPTEYLFLQIPPNEVVTLRLGGTVPANVTRVQLNSSVTASDGTSGRTAFDEEQTDVTVCETFGDGAACDNGDVCGGDTCSGGNCIATACPQACIGAPAGAPCADSNACTLEECDGLGACVPKLSTTTGTPLSISCMACQTCDPGLGCVVTGTAGTECRSAFGACDAAETCDGVSGLCPEDLFQPLGTSCDDGLAETIDDMCIASNPPGGLPRCAGSPDPCGNGVMDPGEACDDGNQVAGDCCSPSCQFEAAGTSCADATVCNGDEMCDGAGSCQAGTPVVCDSGTICATSGVCDPVLGCQFPPAPAVGCKTGFEKASLLVNELKPGSEKLILKLDDGPAIDRAEFDNPTLGGASGYTVCFYREDDGGFAGDLQLDRAQETCRNRPCWNTAGATGYRYKDRDHSADGVGLVKLKAGADGRSMIIVKGKNNARKGQASLPAGANGISQGLRDSFGGAKVQFRLDDGSACFEADVSTVIRTGPTYFHAKK